MMTKQGVVGLVLVSCLLWAGLSLVLGDDDVLTTDVTQPVCILGGIRKDCCPGGCSSSQCISRGCCWDPLPPPPSVQQSPFPWCFQSNPPVAGYKVSSVTTTPYGLEATLSLLQGFNTFGADINPLHLSVFMETPTRLRVKIFDPNNQRWEVPGVVQTQTPSRKPSQTAYIFTYTTAPFGFAVQRASDGSTLFNTTTNGLNFNGLVFEDQYLEISTQLPNQPNIYGLGEHMRSLQLTTHQYYTLFSADHGGTPVDINLYGAHAFYLDLRTTQSGGGNAHGVFLLNSNGMDVFLGYNSLTYRTIGGIFDFYFFLGPSPADVIQQYTDVIGKPYFPPYWTLGWNQCRWGYHTLQDVETVVQKYAQNNIPLETMWTDIDYMNKYWDFTWDPVRFPQDQVRQFVDTLHANNQHYVVITDCGIANVTGYSAWDEGLQRGIFIQDKNGKPFIGQVWPGTTAWPDFFNPNTAAYWQDMLQNFIDGVPVDGIWIDMNEIDSFCDGDCASKQVKHKKLDRQAKPATLSFDPNNPPYAIDNGGQKNPLDTKTIPMDTLHYNNLLEYNAHSMYGFTEAIATKEALENIYKKRAFVIGRSTFPGQGTHATHWLGDNYSSWSDMYYSIPGILSFSLFGMPLVGADICGFEGDTTEELCARWMELGAFYPFSRNHNAAGSTPQEPYVWPSVAAISANIIRVKYSLLPYYYTLFYNASVLGTTVARPLFFEFPSDYNTLSLDQQFLIGPGLLISPVLQQGATSVNAYFPGNDFWYDFYTHAPVVKGPQYLNLNTPLNKIQLHLRAGYIIPTQTPEMTLAESRKNPFTLLVPLTLGGSATGHLYLDDGESLNTIQSGLFFLANYSVSTTTVSGQPMGTLVAVVAQNGWSGVLSLTLAQINVLGVSASPSTVKVNGQPYASFTYSSNTKELIIQNINMPIYKSWTITWA